MRAFSCPARYRPFVEAQLRLTIAEIDRDIDRREDDDRHVRHLATVPDQFIDPADDGTLTILVGIDAPAPCPEDAGSPEPTPLITAGATAP